MIRSGTDLCNDLYDLAREQNGQDVWLNLNGVPAYIIQDLNSADYVLRLNAKNYHKNMLWLKQALGLSRFTEDGKAWEIRRDLTQPFFTKFDREQTCVLACDCAKVTLQKMIKDSANGVQRMDDDVFRHLAISVLMKNFFSISLEDAQIDISSIGQLMAQAAEYAFIPVGEVDKQVSKDLLMQLLKLRRQVLIDLAPFRHGQMPSSPLLDALLCADAKGDVILEHELLTLFAGGAETTAATLGWLCYLLACHPQKQEELFRQCQPYTDVTRWDPISNLWLVEAWISEALRLYPAAALVDRLAVEEDTINGEKIAAGSNVMISMIGLHHNKALYPNPWELNLGTATAPAQDSKNNGIRTAFSFGPRVCGGKHFALVELAAFVHTLVTHVRFELTSQDDPVFVWKSLLLRQGGQPIRVIPRG